MSREEKLKEFIGIFNDFIERLAVYPKDQRERILLLIFSQMEEDYVDEFLRFGDIVKMKKKLKELEKTPKIYREAKRF